MIHCYLILLGDSLDMGCEGLKADDINNNKDKEFGRQNSSSSGSTTELSSLLPPPATPLLALFLSTRQAVPPPPPPPPPPLPEHLPDTPTRADGRNSRNRHRRLKRSNAQTHRYRYVCSSFLYLLMVEG